MVAVVGTYALCNSIPGQLREGDMWGQEKANKPQDIQLSEMDALLEGKWSWVLVCIIAPNRVEKFSVYFIQLILNAKSCGSASREGLDTSQYYASPMV